MINSEQEERMLDDVREYVAKKFESLPVVRIQKGTNPCFAIGDPSRYVLKIMPWNGDGEQYALRKFQEAGVPVAPLVKYDARPENFDGRSILVTQFIEHNPQDHCTMQQKGTLLRKMHTIKADGFGYIKKEKGQSYSWKEFVKTYTTYWEQEARYLNLDYAKYTKFIDQLPENNVLLHGDLRYGNVLMLGEKIKAVIDPHGIIGDPFFDIAMASYDLGEDLNALLDGYKDESISDKEIRTIRDYQNIIRLHKIGWVSKTLNDNKNISEQKRDFLEAKIKRYLTGLSIYS